MLIFFCEYKNIFMSNINILLIFFEKQIIFVSKKRIVFVLNRIDNEKEKRAQNKLLNYIEK